MGGGPDGRLLFCQFELVVISTQLNLNSSSSSSVVIYTQRLNTTVTSAGVSTKQIRLQLPAESFDCDVRPTDICWRTVPESWSGGSERTIAKPCACGNARTGVCDDRSSHRPVSPTRRQSCKYQLMGLYIHAQRRGHSPEGVIQGVSRGGVFSLLQLLWCILLAPTFRLWRD